MSTLYSIIKVHDIRYFIERLLSTKHLIDLNEKDLINWYIKNGNNKKYTKLMYTI